VIVDLRVIDFTLINLFREVVFMSNNHGLQIVVVGTIKIKLYDGTIYIIQWVEHDRNKICIRYNNTIYSSMS